MKQHRSGVNKMSWHCTKKYVYPILTVTPNSYLDFPLLTTKKTSPQFVLDEFDFFLNGYDNVNQGSAHFKRVWDDWADESGKLGPVYGVQWRRMKVVDPLGMPANYQPYITLPESISPVKNTNYGYFDQLGFVINQLKEEPDSTRHIVNSWNWGDIPNMCLPPCHMMFQFYVQGGFLDLTMYQRSADILIGVPYNIAFYSLLLCYVARETGFIARNFVHDICDAHIYDNQLNLVDEILSQEDHPLPSLEFINNKPTIHNYRHSKFVKLPVVV